MEFRSGRKIFKKTFVPRAHTRVRPYGKIMTKKYKYHREQTYFSNKFYLHDNNCPLSIVNFQLKKGGGYELRRQIIAVFSIVINNNTDSSNSSNPFCPFCRCGYIQPRPYPKPWSRQALCRRAGSGRRREWFFSLWQRSHSPRSDP